jgi:hypothetical protein
MCVLPFIALVWKHKEPGGCSAGSMQQLQDWAPFVGFRSSACCGEHEHVDGSAWRCVLSPSFQV